MANQHLSGSNDLWKKKVGYHRRSVAETAVFRIKTLQGCHLSMHDYDAQVGEAIAMVNVRYVAQHPDRITGVPAGAILLVNLIYSAKHWRRPALQCFYRIVKP